MANLGLIESRLNTDARFRADFLRDPVGVLQREGIVLSPDMQQDLRKQVALASTKLKAVPGAAPGSASLGVVIKWE